MSQSVTIPSVGISPAIFSTGTPFPSSGPTIINTDEYVAKLKNALKDFERSTSFTKGQLVTWKTGMRNTLRPAYNEPAIVVEILESPIIDDRQEMGSPYFRQKLDLVLGLLNQDQDFVLFHFDSRRFEAFAT